MVLLQGKWNILSNSNKPSKMKTVRVHFSSPHFVLSKQSNELIITLTPPIIPYLEFDRCNTDDDRDADLSELPLPIRILVLLLLRGRFCPAGDTADDILFFTRSRL